MKRFSLLILSVFLLASPSFANHITGGEVYYTYVGPSGSGYQYHVTLKLFRDHFSTGAMLDPTAALAVFDRITGAMIWNGNIVKTREVQLQLTSPSPCINNPPVVYYDVGYYEFDLILPDSPNGYIIAYQRCCRIAGINNLANSVSVGTTYSAEIPGNSSLSTAPQNNSAQFVGADTVIVCAHNQFSYSFAAQDADGDRLSYSFCDAFIGGNSTTQPAPNPPAAPPYFVVPYASPFSGSQPLGNTVSLDPTTGLITGIAPDAGIYVVTVCVTETRNGVVIATQRKDLQIKVGDCDVARALLNPQYITCDGFTMTFQNLSTSPLINSYFWDFGVPVTNADTSNLAIPTFTYPDTGAYTIKLVTNRNQQCSDSTTAIVKVYPGFFPAFNSIGICVTNPVRFTDATSTVYGVVDTWSWNFGDATTAGDT
ncbi:MAG TPA: PKD domain-containing protein, partial [Chitinophagaceae bacterium]|nr:PKD domain-containing protein [Chitinophagaceae bacterium]